MEIKWLEDFVSLAETRSFSRSAEQRHVTQPAFSRRIQALESWFGAALIDRSSYPTRLTSAGEVFYEQALAMLNQVSETRLLLRGQRSADASLIDVAATHTLSLTVFPQWLKSLEPVVGMVRCRLRALNVHDAALMLSEGSCDLLLVYHHPSLPVQLDAVRYPQRVLGTERLAPYSLPDDKGRPLFRIGSRAARPQPFLAYTPNAYLGRLVNVLIGDLDRSNLQTCYETDMAEGLKSMVLAGHGLAFLPESAVRDEVASGALVRADSRSQCLQADMEIRLHRVLSADASVPTAIRARHSAQRRGPSIERGKQVLLDRIWEHLSSKG